MPPNVEVHGIGATLEIAFTLNRSILARRKRSEHELRARDRDPDRQRASALALHLDCSRVYIGKLEAEGVIQWLGASFPLD